MEQGLSLCPDFVVQGTHENKLTMKISQITVVRMLGYLDNWLLNADISELICMQRAQTRDTVCSPKNTQ